MIRRLQQSLVENGDLDVVIYVDSSLSEDEPVLVVSPGHRSPYGDVLPDYIYGPKGDTYGPDVLFLGDLTENRVRLPAADRRERELQRTGAHLRNVD